MGISLSCPFSDDGFENAMDSVIVKSINFGEKDFRTMTRSISFKKNEDSDPTILRSLGSGKIMVVEGSISFNRRESETTMISITAPWLDEGKNKSYSAQDLKCEDTKNEAALSLQKFYKSFRTRRKLADCAVLVELEQSWWNLLDSAELKQSSVTFFDLQKQETAISRWSRARTRAAKVGKGLSKNNKAQKLALQHWLEAIDPRHRYGHNLHFYYLKWLACESREPFFYWLDAGEGKEVNLFEKCPRSTLHHQCIKYLGPMERKAYEVEIIDGRMFYKQSQRVLDTRGLPKDTKWIFVLSTTKALYVGKKKKGKFQHSSFLAGGATSAAGRLVVENGILKAVWPHSGHYRPTKENFQDLISFLSENNVNLANVKMNPVDMSNVESTGSTCDDDLKDSKEFVSEDPILRDRLGANFKRTWTTGAGPRISCVRDHPSDLQFRALEHVNLSPRSARTSTNASWFRLDSSPKRSNGINHVFQDTMGGNAPFLTQPSPLSG